MDKLKSSEKAECETCTIRDNGICCLSCRAEIEFNILMLLYEQEAEKWDTLSVLLYS